MKGSDYKSVYLELDLKMDWCGLNPINLTCGSKYILDPDDTTNSETGSLNLAGLSLLAHSPCLYSDNADMEMNQTI